MTRDYNQKVFEWVVPIEDCQDNLKYQYWRDRMQYFNSVDEYTDSNIVTEPENELWDELYNHITSTGK